MHEKLFLESARSFFIVRAVFTRKPPACARNRQQVRLREIHNLRFKFTIVKLARRLRLDPVCREWRLEICLRAINGFSLSERYMATRSRGMQNWLRPRHAKHPDAGCRKSVIGRLPDDEINAAWQN